MHFCLVEFRKIRKVLTGVLGWLPLNLHILEKGETAVPLLQNNFEALNQKWEINDSEQAYLSSPFCHLLHVIQNKERDVYWGQSVPSGYRDLLAAVSVTECVGISNGTPPQQ